jgi:outer membrane protein assembly factor BamB
MIMPSRLWKGIFSGVVPLTLFFCNVGFADDWPMWRGPERDGICRESGLAKEWPESGPRLAWKATGLGAGYSGVTVVGNRVYTAGETGAVSSVICLDAGTGKQLWASKLGKAGSPGGFAGPRATPTIDRELLFAVDPAGEFVCYDKSSGKELWRKSYTGDFGGTEPHWGYSESPLVDGDRVLGTPGGPKGAVVALNKKTGAVRWQSRDFKDLPHYSCLVPAVIGGVKQYVQLTAEHVVGLAVDDGAVLWETARKGATAVIPTPIIADDCVYVTSGYGIGCNLFRITKADGKFKAEQVYANKVMVNHHGGVVKVGEYLYGYSDGKGWTCQDFKTGEAKWQEKKLGKGAILAAGDRLVLRQEDKAGTMVLIEASPEGWKEHGRFDQPDRSSKNSWPHPVIANGKLYIRDQDVLLAYDVQGK